MGKGWRNINEMVRYNGYTPNPKESEAWREGFDLKIKAKNIPKTRLMTESEREIFF